MEALADPFTTLSGRRRDTGSSAIFPGNSRIKGVAWKTKPKAFNWRDKTGPGKWDTAYILLTLTVLIFAPRCIAWTLFTLGHTWELLVGPRAHQASLQLNSLHCRSSQESQLGITQLEDILARLAVLQGQGGRVGVSLTGHYQAPETPKSCTVQRRLQSRILPLILSSKFSRTAHMGVIFLICSCLIGDKWNFLCEK